MGPLPSCTILNKLFFLTKRRSYSTYSPRPEAKGPPLATHLTAPPSEGGGTSSPQNRCFRQSPEESAGWEGRSQCGAPNRDEVFAGPGSRGLTRSRKPAPWRRAARSDRPSSTATWPTWGLSACACWTRGPTTCTWM